MKKRVLSGFCASLTAVVLALPCVSGRTGEAGQFSAGGENRAAEIAGTMHSAAPDAASAEVTFSLANDISYQDNGTGSRWSLRWDASAGGHPPFPLLAAGKHPEAALRRITETHGRRPLPPRLSFWQPRKPE